MYVCAGGGAVGAGGRDDAGVVVLGCVRDDSVCMSLPSECQEHGMHGAAAISPLVGAVREV